MKARTAVYFLILMSIFMSSINLFCADGKEEAEKFYRQAISCLQNRDTTAAISYLKKAIRKNHKLAKAHNELAMIFMNEGTVYGRFKATFEIEKAIRFDPNNLQYRYNQALLNLKKGMTAVAERQFKKILEKDPDNYQCCLHLASLKEKEMLHYQNMISLEPGSDGIIFFQEFADKLLDQTSEYYRKAISLRPQKTEPYYRLAMIFYEYEKFEEMVQLLESAVKINPGDKNCHLFLGLGYYELDKFNLAAAEFEKAKNLMSAEELAVMESIETILSDSEKVAYLAMGPHERSYFVNQFWKKNEPFFLTGVNERKLEHYSRVAYANLRFSDPAKNIEGWKTDMGKVYIRYGKPKRRYRTRPYLGGKFPGSKNPLVASKEIWIYDDFDFKFEDEYLSGNYAFCRSRKPEFDYKLIYENMVKEKPSYYQLSPDSSTFPVVFEMVDFLNEKKNPDPEFCFSIPLDSLRFEGILPIGKELQTGLFIFSQDWKPVVSRKSEFTLDKENFISAGEQLHFSGHKDAPLPPGKYFLSLEFKENFSGKIGRVREEIEVDSVGDDELKMSQILIAQKIEPDEFNYSAFRKGLKILPNPSHKFLETMPVAVYFEVYNLHPGANGEAHYRVEYTTSADTKSNTIFAKAMELLGLKKSAAVVTTSYEYSSKRKNVGHYQYLTLKKSLGYQQKLQIKIIDLVSGENVSQSATVKLIEQE